MLAPEVESVIVTLCAEEYVPVAGVITGVAAADWLMVMTDDAVALCVRFGAVAIAFTVVVVPTVKEPVYWIEELVG